MPEKHQGLESHCFFPLRLHPSFQTHPDLGHCLLLTCLGGCTLERDFSWGPQNQQTWRLGDLSKILVARASGHHPLGALGSMVPARANQMVRLRGAQLRAPTLTVSTPLQSNPRDPSLVGFQGLESSPSQGDQRG